MQPTILQTSPSRPRSVQAGLSVNTPAPLYIRDVASSPDLASPLPSPPSPDPAAAFEEYSNRTHSGSQPSSGAPSITFITLVDDDDALARPDYSEKLGGPPSRSTSADLSEITPSSHETSQDLRIAPKRTRGRRPELKPLQTSEAHSAEYATTTVTSSPISSQSSITSVDDTILCLPSDTLTRRRLFLPHHTDFTTLRALLLDEVAQ